MHSKGEAKVKVDVELEFQDIAEFEIWEPEEQRSGNYFRPVSPFHELFLLF